MRADRSQKEFGQLVGLAQGTISQYETGERDITIDGLAEILNKIGVSLAEFFVDDNQGEHEREENQGLDDFRRIETLIEKMHSAISTELRIVREDVQKLRDDFVRSQQPRPMEGTREKSAKAS